jgi:hypothetical protein
VGERYGKTADVYSFALTMLEFCIKGKQDLRAQLHDWLLDSMEPAMREKVKMKEVNYGRVGHHMVASNWRPRNNTLLIGIPDMPKSMAGLLSVCWTPEPEDRPDFKEILKWIDEEVRVEVSEGKSGEWGKNGGALMEKIQKAVKIDDSNGFLGKSRPPGGGVAKDEYERMKKEKEELERRVQEIQGGTK